MNGTNYLVPVDAKLKTTVPCSSSPCRWNALLVSVGSARKLRLVILDACRHNPFGRDMAKTVASRSVGRGLARIELGSSATLAAYGEGRAGGLGKRVRAGNSSFATAIIRNTQKPGIEIRKFFGLVRDDVMVATEQTQEPFVDGSLGGDDYFLRKP